MRKQDKNHVHATLSANTIQIGATLPVDRAKNLRATQAECEALCRQLNRRGRVRANRKAS